MASRNRHVDLEWLQLRDTASLVGCTRCGALPGLPCRNVITGEELPGPAHWQRLRAGAELKAARDLAESVA